MKKIELKHPDHRYNNMSIPVVAVTGNIGTGKSTFCSLLESKGYSILKADHIVKLTYSLPEVRNQIKQWAPEVFESDDIDFKKLRTMFFSSKQLKSDIENLIYNNMPGVFTNELVKLNSPDFIFYEIPLIFEKGLEDKFDMIICVSLDPKSQLERLKKRDYADRDENEIKNILAAQFDLREKESRSHLTVNSKTSETLEQGVKEFENAFLPQLLN